MCDRYRYPVLLVKCCVLASKDSKRILFFDNFPVMDVGLHNVNNIFVC